MATRISLDDQLFQQALEQYMDESKPDPLALKQLKAWKLEWKESDQDIPKEIIKIVPNNAYVSSVSSGGGGDDDNDDDNNNNSMVIPFDPSHIINGTLTIHGEYVILSLGMLCAWKPSTKKSNYGSLFYFCHVVSGEFIHVTKKDKISSKIISRLRQDDYITSIISKTKKPPQPNTNSSIKDKDDGGGENLDDLRIVAQATIHVDDGNLEERVHSSEHFCEAIKRAIWSSAESPLDVVELILNLPSLPTTISSASTTTTDDATIAKKTPLANRAKLRLLEDAMADACEQEGEGEIISELNISEASNNNNDEGSDSNKNDSNDQQSAGGGGPRKKKKKRSN